MSEQRPTYETGESKDTRTDRQKIIDNLKIFPWERTSDGFLLEVNAFMLASGFDFLGSSLKSKKGQRAQ